MHSETIVYQRERPQSMLTRLLGSWVVSVAGIWFSDLFGLLSYGDSLSTLLLSALVLATINTFIRPVLTILSIPFIIVTLGFFMLVVSAFTLWITSELVDSFELYGFWHTIGAAIILALSNAIIGGALRGPPVKTEVMRVDT